MTRYTARHAMGPAVSGVALVARDGFSARYDLDRIAGVFSRPQHALAGQSYVGRILVLDTAKDAFDLVLATVGASQPVRDAVDARLIEHARTRTGKMIDSQVEVGGWPALKSATAPADADDDGIPDEWETRHGLNPRQASDASAQRP